MNWKNFYHCNVSLSERTFIVGANASGKSNFMDAFRFLHDLAKAGGGLQAAVAARGGMTKIRCLAARKRTDVEFTVCLKENVDGPVVWKYVLSFKNVGGGIFRNEASILKEEIWHNSKLLKRRTPQSQGEDADTLKYTHLEQATSNKDFRDLRTYFVNINYLNVIPQFVRESSSTIFSFDTSLPRSITLNP